MLMSTTLRRLVFRFSFSFFFFSSRRRHTRFDCDWSSDVCSSDLHHLLGLFSQITLDSLYRRFQFSRVTGGLAHSKRHNDLRLGIGGNLDVIAGAKSPFRLYHVARLRVGGTGAKLFFLSLCFLLSQLFGPSTLKLLQLLERLLKPLVLLAQRSLSSLSHPLTQLFRARISHRFNLLLSLFKVRFKRLLAPKAFIRCRGLNLGPIVHHTLKGDQPLMAEHPQDRSEEHTSE